MAWSIVPDPSTVLCPDPCEHAACEAWRAFFADPCPHCGKPLEPGQTFCYPSRARIAAGEATEHGGEHFACMLERAR